MFRSYNRSSHLVRDTLLLQKGVNAVYRPSMRPSSLFHRKSRESSRVALINFESSIEYNLRANNMHDLKAEALRLGATDLRPSWRKGKKIAVLFQGKWIHAGALGYDDYTTHHDDERRASYRRRHKAIPLRDGRPAYLVKTQPSFWSWHLLW